MSLNHIVLNGKKDVELDVKSLVCDDLTVTNGLYDQSLNTTDDVTFNKITLTSTMFTDPNQAVNKQYVDDSAPGLSSLDIAYQGGNTINTQPGFPVELLGTEGITLAKTNFTNPQELVTKKYVDDATPTITLQDAYDNGNTIITTPGNNVDIQGSLDASFVNTTQLSSSSDLTIGITNQGQILAQSLLLTTPQVTISGQTSTQQTIFPDPQNLVTKQYVLDEISAIPSSAPNQSITWSLQGILDDYDVTTTISTIPLSSVVDGNLSINYPGVGDFHELNPSVRTGDIVTVPSTGWYSIRMTYSHPPLPILGTNAQSGLGSDCKIFIKINGSNRIPLGQEDSAGGITESISTVIDRYLTSGSTIEWEWDFGTAQSNEDFFINCSVINMTKSITLSNFTGATPTSNGTEGLVPPPVAGDQYKILSASGIWVQPNRDAIFDVYGNTVFDYYSNVDPTTNGITLNGGASWQQLTNNYYISLLSGGGQNRSITFSPGNYNNFRYEVRYKILNTTQPADILAFFANGTTPTPSSELSTGGLVFYTDYYNNATYIHKYYVYNGAISLAVGQLSTIDDINDQYNRFVMTRIGNEITVEIESDYVGKMKYSFTDSSTTAGTYWGLFGKTGGSSMTVEIRHIKLQVLP